ncbi:MAG: 4Fe-4S dicluster domain-containing protein [Promethearchaeota archaeon]
MPENYEDLIKRCYQCGTCTGACPSAKITGTFNPRKIIAFMLRGSTDKMVADDVIWLCTACHACVQRCPELVYPAEVLFQLKNVATSNGKFPIGLKEEAIQIYLTGTTVAPSSPIERRRKKLGLPEFPAVNVDEVRKIMELTGLDKKLKFNGTAVKEQKDNEEEKQ